MTKVKTIAILLAVLFLLPNFAEAKSSLRRHKPIQKFVSKVDFEAAKINDVYVVLFILDGTPRYFLNGLIESGDLPNLKKYFYDNGARFTSTTTTFPSASAPAYQGYITGLFAGHSGITYLQWFDRELQKEVDYLGLDFMRVNGDMWNYYAMLDPKIEGLDHPVTIFEKLKGHSSASVYSEISRGSNSSYPSIPIAALGSAFITGRYEMLDSRAMNRVEKLFRQPVELLPRFTLVGLYGPDVSQHMEGVAAENTKYVLQGIDKRFGEFVDLLKARGIFEKTYIVVVSDHGMHDVKDEVDVQPLLKEAGFKVKHTGLKKEDADIFISERGVSSAHLYFLKDNLKRRDEVVQLLRGQPKISLVISRDGGEVVRVFSKTCEADISKANIGGHFFYGYKPKTCDPLDYCTGKKSALLCDGTLYDKDVWLRATYDKKYPDGVVQLGQLFDDERGGDIFLTSDDSGFYKTKVATHGSLLSDDITVPVYITGPTVPHGEFGPIRTVDVHAQILDWFGLPNEEHQDGSKIWDRPVKQDDTEIKLARLESFMFSRPRLAVSANPDDDLAEFKRFVAKENLMGFISSRSFDLAIDAESSRRIGQIEKFKMILSTLKRSDLAYFVIESELASAKNSIHRLDDVRNLVEDLRPRNIHWYRPPSRLMD